METEKGLFTAIEVGLLSHLIIRVAVRVNRAVKLLKSHQCSYQPIVGVKQAPEPLFRFNVVNLDVGQLDTSLQQRGPSIRIG